MLLYAKSDLELMVGQDEKILCKGKPNKLCYILEGIFNPMLPFALVWLLFDSVFISLFLAGSTSSDSNSPLPIFIIGFFLLHLMPVWIYLGGILFVFRKYKHTEYIVTDKGVYISGGTFAYSCQMKPFSELSRVNISRGVIDQMLGVGDVVLTSNNMADLMTYRRNQPMSSMGIGLQIQDISNYQQVYDLIKNLQADIYSDTMYPNDLRPETNHGYNTKYTKYQDRGQLDI